MIMERKIGEIFEYNGGWYQAVEQTEKSCKACYFYSDEGCFVSTGLGWCRHYSRNDNKSVIFKKLEKVGEPYEFQKRIIQAYELYTTPFISANMDFVFTYLNGSSTINIIIKQNKEDMEDLDKIKVRDYTKVEELNVMEENKLNLKPFDIQKAREGKPVCTREGRKARIICFDAEGEHPIIALVSDGVRESPYNYTKEGYYHIEGVETMADLMMLPEKKEGWVNVYKRENEYICENECNVSTGIAVYKSEGEAKRNIDKNEIYVNTIKISWEE